MHSETDCKVLVVQDDAGICKFLKTTLTANGYEVLVTSTGQQALEIISSHCPDCILLDLGLPDMDGNRIIENVRSWTTTPIIVISARSTEEDKAYALDLGADDYLIKPFGTIELLARIRTALRHTRTARDNDSISLGGVYRVGDLTIDYRKHSGQVVTYKTMLRELWGPYASRDNKILRVHMANIRRKIEPNPDEPIYIFTEVGVGYRMAEAVEG